MSKNIFQVKHINFQQSINTNRFTIKFPGLTNKLINQAQTSTLPGVRKRWEAVQVALSNDPGISLELALASVSVPNIELEHQFITRFNDGVKAVTRFTEMPDMDCTFWDYVDGSASAIMQLWHAFVGDKETGAIGFKQDYVLPKAHFYVYGPDAPGYSEDFIEANQEVPWLQKYAIIKLFPKSIQLGEHSSDSAEARKVTVTFSLDNFYPVGIRTYNYQATTPEERYTEIPDVE